MAKRVRKTYKQRRRELEAPEIVEEKLWDLSEWMEANWRPVVGALAMVTVIWGGIGIFQMISESGQEASAAATAGVFSTLARPVYVKPEGTLGKDPNKPIGPTFESDKARAEAVLAEIAKAPQSDAAPLIGVLEGGVKAGTHDYAAQVARIDAVLGGDKGSPLALALLQQEAGALTALGRTEEASAAWQKVAEASRTACSKARALLRVGDLHNARAGAAKADPAKAEAAYRGALKATEKDGKAPDNGALAFLHAEAQVKLAGL